MQSSLGIDYGTNSVRALIVDCSTGAELASSVVDYPSGHQGVLLDRNKDIAYTPDPENQKTYNDLYRLYRALHDAFGGVNRNADLSRVMKDLIAIKHGWEA